MIIDFEEKCDVISEIKEEEYPLYIYGAGFVARKVVNICKENHIENLRGAIVDDAYYQKDAFLEGIPVYTVEPVLTSEKSGFSIVMGMKNMYAGYLLKEKYNQIKKVYYIPDLACEDEFYLSKDEYIKHQEKILEVYHLLEDSLSRDIFVAWIKGCVTQDVTKVFSFCKEKTSYFCNDIFNVIGDSGYIDVGAYIGDTIEEYLKYNRSVKHIYAFEGDAEFCKKMYEIMHAKYYEYVERLEIYNCILWSSSIPVAFEKSAKGAYVGECVRESGQEEKRDIAKTLDEIVLDKIESVELLKINVIGSGDVLEGATKIVEKFHPKIAMKVGWTGFANMYKIIKVLKRYNYQIYMRFNDARLEELTIYAKYIQ